MNKELAASLSLQAECLNGFAYARIIRMGVIIEEYGCSRAQVRSPCLHLCDRLLEHVRRVDVQQVDRLLLARTGRPWCDDPFDLVLTSGPTSSK